MAKIAVAQIEIQDDLQANVKKVLECIDQAQFKEAQLICFPETALGDTPLEVKSDQIQTIQQKCKEKDIYCIFGFLLKEVEKEYNAAVLIDDKGLIQYVYRKRHPFPGLDLKSTVRGQSNQVIETSLGKIGIIICWDFAFPEEIRQLVKSGAEIIFCPSYLLDSAKVSKDVFRALPLTRAFENLCYFVTCDAFTDETLSESYICSPEKVMNKIKNREGIIFAELNLTKIRTLRKQFDHLK